MKQRTHFWGLLILAILLVGGVATFLMPMMPAILMGFMTASVLYPFYRKLQQKMSGALAATIIVLIFCLVQVIPFIWITWHGAMKTYQFISDKMANFSNMNEASDAGIALLREKYQTFAANYGLRLPPLHDVTQSVLKWSGEHAIQATQYTLQQIPNLVLFAFISLLALFYGLMEGHLWPKRVSCYGLLHQDSVRQIIKRFHASCRMVVVSNIITGAVQASCVAIGAFIAGAGDPVVIGFITFILSFIPMIGAAPFSVVLGVAQFLMGNYSSGIIMLVTAGVAGSIDNFIRPLLMSGTEDFHPILSFISIISGLILFGVPGVFLGPMIVSVSIGILPVVWKELRQYL